MTLYKVGNAALEDFEMYYKYSLNKINDLVMNHNIENVSAYTVGKLLCVSNLEGCSFRVMTDSHEQAQGLADKINTLIAEAVRPDGTIGPLWLWRVELKIDEETGEVEKYAFFTYEEALDFAFDSGYPYVIIDPTEIGE